MKPHHIIQEKKQHKSNYYNDQQIRHNHPSLFFAEESCLKQKRRVIHLHKHTSTICTCLCMWPTHSLTLKHITWKKSYCIGARNHYQNIHKTVHTIQYIKGDPVTDWKPIYLYSAPFRPWRTSSNLYFLPKFDSVNCTLNSWNNEISKNNNHFYNPLCKHHLLQYIYKYTN